MNRSFELRSLLSQQGLIVAPGAYDCITAKVIEQAGFPAVYMTGAGTSMSLAGLPDYGLLTMTEMVQNAARIAGAVNIPVIADADTGYGNELNVIRAVREYEKHGIAGVHIEDQSFPKKCGHLDNKQVVGIENFLAKIRAAVHERLDPSFVVIARTDARAVLGFEEAIRRANAAADAGADLIFVEAPQSVDEIRDIPRRVHAPCVLNLAQGGKTPMISLDDAEGCGFKLAILPGLLVTTVMAACDDALAHVRKTGTLPPLREGFTIREKFRRFGADVWDQLAAQYASPENG
ncbi:MAG: isocitrate lyase/PEP mutase family protein [Alicyclobacillus sp.]|nr:isocitrate lyase/PEP mutase family protein [Alicyclobacillus sp.]